MKIPYDIKKEDCICIIRGYRAIAPGPLMLNDVDVEVTSVTTMNLRELDFREEREMKRGDLKSFLQLHYPNLLPGDNVTILRWSK